MRSSMHDATAQCSSAQRATHLRQVYRAVRNSVQDAAVKLLTNVDAAQLATFSHVIHTLSCCTAVLILSWSVPHALCKVTHKAQTGSMLSPLLDVQQPASFVILPLCQCL